MYKYYISIISMFKNESSILNSWLQHYIEEDIEHFYLIDNGSTDNFKPIIENYKNKITLVSDKTRFDAINHQGPQQYLQNKYFLNKVKKESKWVFICDIDEYLFNKRSKFIKDYLKKNENYNLIHIPYVFFGTIFDETPVNLIDSLTKCNEHNGSNESSIIDEFSKRGKSIIKTQNLIKIDCHFHKVCDLKILNLDYKSDLILNHYYYISNDYFVNFKCKRGGGVHGLKSLDYNCCKLTITAIPSKL